MKTLFLTLSAILTIVLPAFAAAPCTVSIKDWQPREALRQKLEEHGWDVRAIKAKNGCYQAHAVDASGVEIYAYFDPKSFTAVGVADHKTQ
jgi:hypothetical protein